MPLYSSWQHYWCHQFHQAYCSSPALWSSTVAWNVFFMMTCTGSTFPNEFSSSLVWQFVGVCDTELPVPGGLLYVRLWRRQSSASTFRQSSSAHGAASPTQHIRPSGVRSGWSVVPKLITEQSPRVGVWWLHFRQLFQTFTENISL